MTKIKMRKKRLIGWVNKDFGFKVYTPTFQSWKGTPFYILPRITLKEKYKIRSRFKKIKVRITIEEIK